MQTIDISELKILIVDDQQANINVLQGLLQFKGYKNIMSLTDSRMAIDTFNSFNPDLILLDLRMPHLTGFEVMEQLKTIIPEYEYLPILVLTADITIETKQKALASGAVDFLSKPFDLVEVDLRIKNLLVARYLYLQQLNQTQLLELKVKERTLELEKTNAALVIAKERAEESDRLKSQFLATISHELRTPLNHILGFSGIIEPLILDGEMKSMVATIHNSGKNLLGIIENIFSLAFAEQSKVELKPQKFKGAEIFIENRINLIEILNLSGKDKKISLTFNPDYGLLMDYITADRTKINQVLTNLFKNAVKYTEKGTIEFGFYKYDTSNIVFYVKDSGIGIEKDKQVEIFNFFHQIKSNTNKVYDGVGIGLAISKKIADAMKAEIRVESELKYGATFFFSVPVQVSYSENNPSSTVIGGTVPNLEGKTILIAEDDAESMRLLKLTLQSTKVNLIGTTNGLSAIKYFNKMPGIDLVIMDLRMPGIDGFSATRTIKKNSPETPVIALTSYSLKNDIDKAYKAGCDDVITKPLDNTELFEVLTKHLIAKRKK